MSGIRIRHNTARSGLFIVPLIHKPFPTQPPRPICGACQRAGQTLRHPCKTVHVVLDDTGAVIVSTEIWADFQKCANRAGFIPANVVLKPPSQTFTPATIKLHIDAIQFGETNDGTQYSTGSGKMSRPVTVPHIMDIDTYLDKAEQAGIGNDDAANLLLAAKLNGGH